MCEDGMLPLLDYRYRKFQLTCKCINVHLARLGSIYLDMVLKGIWIYITVAYIKVI